MTELRNELQDLALKYRGYLWALACASLGPGFRNQLDPADVVQATLVKAAESQAVSPGGDEQCRLAWLRQVLKSVLVDEYRRLHRDRRDIRREQQLLEDSVDTSALGLQACLAADQTSPSQAAVRNERLLLLADALVQLPYEQREVVVQRYLQGRSVSAIAESLGRTVPAVAGLLRRGLDQLRSLLPETGGQF
ncbi:MAG: sigma-70 family RNA polymerase sigma factor [Planctomycetia bacterium]|jgi:RNA polymerase sigma-70 factor (ECF subfamily)